LRSEPLWTIIAVRAAAAGPLLETDSLHRQNLHEYKAHRHNELRLAGLVPGRTSIIRARTVLGNVTINDTQNHSVAWRSCTGDLLDVDLDERGIVQMVRVEDRSEQGTGMEAGSAGKNGWKRGCNDASPREAGWSTGMGLRVGSPTQRVLQLYGEPDSRSPSTKDGQRLELLYYAFDWAGPDVPQVMEVLCTVGTVGKPGRVLEITLAASSL